MMVSAARFVLLLSSLLTTSALDFLKDSRNDCSEQVELCRSSDTVWFDCPIACAEKFTRLGQLTKPKNREKLYDMIAFKDNGSVLEMEDLEGYIILYAVIPLLPGMAQFYYELLEHIRLINTYTVASIILPYRKRHTNDEDDEDGVVDDIYKSIVPNKHYDTSLLKETDLDTTPAILGHIMSATFEQGNMHDKELDLDVASVYVVSSGGTLIQKLTSPTFREVQKAVSMFNEEFMTDKEQRRHASAKMEL
jgi:hypothetical protein